jgi:hypothetical protein
MNSAWLRFPVLSAIQRLLAFAAVLYCLVAVATFHPDNKIVLFWASLEGPRIINIWEYGERHHPNFSQFNYPPAHYVIDKAFYFLAKPIAGDGFDEWLISPNDSDQYVPHLGRYALATKVGLIIFALVAGYSVYLLVRRSGTEKQALLSTGLWLFNPITLYSIPIMGQNDVLAMVFFLLGWLAVAKRKVLATIMFGIGASVKMIPLIWVPFLLVSIFRTAWRTSVAIFVASIGIYIATLLPFISNENFQQNILTGNHSQRFLYAQISFGFSEAINIVPILLLLALAAVLSRTLTEKIRLSLPAHTLMTVNLLMLGIAHFHPQWWVWVTLFWAIWIPTVSSKKIGFAIFASVLTFLSWLAIVLLFNDRALTWGLFLPLNPNLANLPTIVSFLIAQGVNTSQLVNLAYSWLAGISLVSLISLAGREYPPLHEIIRIPRFLLNTWSALTSSRMRTKISIVFGIFFVLFSMSLLANSIPAPVSSKPPENIQFVPVTSPHQVQFTPELDMFNRFHLFFTNSDLSGSGTIQITLESEAGSIHQQTIEASNVGFWSAVRFDIPPQIASKSQIFTLTVQPAPLADGSTSQITGINVGITDLNTPSNSLAAQQYFNQSEQDSLPKRALDSLENLVHQAPALFVIAIVVIALLL